MRLRHAHVGSRRFVSAPVLEISLALVEDQTDANDQLSGNYNADPIVRCLRLLQDLEPSIVALIEVTPHGSIDVEASVIFA